MITTACIVLYKNNKQELKRAIDSFLNTELPVYLYLIDNSPVNDLKNIISDNRVKYIHNPSNPGFGAAHNTAINMAIEQGASYHFVINPDIYHDANVIESMINYMEKHDNVGMLMPKVLNLDGTVQNLPKLLPSPFSILLRKLKRPHKFYQRFINRYELRFVSPEIIYKAPILSGCFTLLRLDAIKQVGNYDDRYFMYFEDWDLSRRMNSKFDTIYFPKVSVYHEYDSGANKSFKLFKIYLRSAMLYFNKWGWLFDKRRKQINTETLSQF